ncbi:hypothetical protein HNQ72_002070 [Rhizobium wenxiniae]|uniref:Uncharacterized protein n=1 Tax=Rhizobium wenxiniae TaxID=1737357 RepID=A0A7X0CZD9_9HYPH|nr:hypothetical protein [Rhizobium wenxiniae]
MAEKAKSDKSAEKPVLSDPITLRVPQDIWTISRRSPKRPIAAAAG